MRKMATVQCVAEVRAIEGADAIEHYRINGWWVVGKKGEYQVGDYVCFAEVDSWIPHELVPFLSKGQEPREYNGVKGERLRTIKLRGALSQGMLLPISLLNWNMNSFGVDDIGLDVSGTLGIQKYEPPVPAQLAGLIRGNFPALGRKTDQERIQNVYKEIKDINVVYEVTEKLDGSSMSVMWIEGEFHVCSRNLSIKLEDENNSMVKVAKRYNLQDAFCKLGHNIQISGEIIGEGIQGNKYGLKGHDWYVFDVYDIDQGRYLTPQERWDFLGEHFPELKQAPLIGTTTVVCDLDQILLMAEGKSLLNPKTEREGLVFKAVDRNLSWKAISNKWLMKHE
jgi:RNA ligase (TIGR02306 family)